MQPGTNLEHIRKIGKGVLDTWRNVRHTNNCTEEAGYSVNLIIDVNYRADFVECANFLVNVENEVI